MFFAVHWSTHHVLEHCSYKDRIKFSCFAISRISQLETSLMRFGSVGCCWPGKRYIAIISAARVAARSRERRLWTLCSYGTVLCHQAAHSLQTHLFAAVTPQMLSADDQLVVPHYDNSPSYLINRLVHCGYRENRVKQTRQERLLQVHRVEGGKKNNSCHIKGCGSFSVDCVILFCKWKCGDMHVHNSWLVIARRPLIST